MLNFPLPNSGELDSKELKILDEITRWMAVNSEGIYSTRPWKIFGDGPGTKTAAVPGQRFNENSRKDLTAEDVRFTTKGSALYAFVMGWPGKEASIPALALGGQNSVPRIPQRRAAGPQRQAQVDSGRRGSQGGTAGRETVGLRRDVQDRSGLTGLRPMSGPMAAGAGAGGRKQQQLAQGPGRYCGIRRDAKGRGAGLGGGGWPGLPGD